MLSKIKPPTCFVSGIEGKNIASSGDSYVLQVQVVSCCYQFCSDLRAQDKPGLCVKSSQKPLIGTAGRKIGHCSIVPGLLAHHKFKAHHKSTHKKNGAKLSDLWNSPLHSYKQLGKEMPIHIVSGFQRKKLPSPKRESWTDSCQSFWIS